MIQTTLAKKEILIDRLHLMRRKFLCFTKLIIMFLVNVRFYYKCISQLKIFGVHGTFYLISDWKLPYLARND